MNRSLLMTILIAGFGVQPALAQDRPPMAPTKDATVTYKTLGRDGGQSIQIGYSASGPMRVESPAMGGYAIVDRTRQRTIMVMTEQRMYMELSGTNSAMMLPPAAQGPAEDARFTRKGTETIVGQACTVWDYGTPIPEGTSCISADGVLLRSLAKSGDGIEATRVVYAPIPAANLAPPAGFTKMEMPAMGGPGGMMAPRR